MIFDINTGGKSFFRAKGKEDGTFSLKINRNLLPKENATYPISIKLEDDKGARSTVASTFTVKVEYLDKQELARIAKEEADA